MAASLADARRWTQHGTTLVADAVAALDEAAYGEPTGLPGWTRRHLVAHLAANGEALGNLVHWAASGERTPMYASPQQRDADIEAGSRKSGPELAAWFTRSAAGLETAMDDLAATRWSATVVTAQGRTVPASQTPWLRAREVMVHAVDLGTGVRFDDLPADFLAALCAEVVSRRSASAGTEAGGPALSLEALDTGDRWDVAGEGEPVRVTGPLASVSSYLTGRGADGLVAVDSTDVPDLPAWL